MPSIARRIARFSCLIFVLISVRAYAQISVTATTPNSAAQGTVNLNVTVNGKGFKNGAKAQWFVTSTTNPGGVTVNSTGFVSSTTLTANITVSDTAALANFDVQVTNSDGRTGKGTELFAVVAKGAGNGSCTLRPTWPTSVNTCSSGGAGCIDTSFGSGGSVSIPQINGDNLSDLTMSGTRIVGAIGAGPYSATNSVVAVSSDGSIDLTFGTNGYAQVPAGNEGPNGASIVALADGSIIELASPYLTKLAPSGALDTAFGTNGTVTLANGGEGLALQTNGYILVAGGAVSKGKAQVWNIGRFDPATGKPDSSFGTGFVSFNPGPTTASSVAHAITTQIVNGEEEIVVAGDVFSVARFHANGALDTSFGTSAGVTRVSFFGMSEWVSDIAIDQANRIVVGGQAQTVPNTCGAVQYDWAILRLTPSGIPDNSFGATTAPTGLGQGRVDINFYNGNDRIHRVGIQPDGLNGLIVASGFALDPTSGVSNGVAIRLADDGTMDSTFASNGAAVVSPGSSRAITVQSDGKIVVGDDDAGIRRYWNVVH